MRGTFALVVAAGVAAAVGWSLVRDAVEEPAAPVPEHAPDVRDAPGLVSMDPGDGAPVAPAAQRSPEKAPSAPGDPIVAARAWLASPAPLADAPARAQLLALAESLETRAEALPTVEATESRVLARRLLAALYDAPSASSAERDRAYERCTRLFDVLVKGNGAPASLVLRHKVEPGQNVWALARGPWRAAGVTAAPGFVLWLNGVADARRLRAGQMLKVPLEPLTVLVRKRAFELTVLLGGAPVQRCRVAVGADARTPVGRFQVADCLKNPDWYVNGRRIAFGSPEHIIGTRWIGLAGGPEAAGIGIHGTNDASSIGTTASQGCVRLANADVERIFEWVGAGTAVEIRD
jgi:hypothetical protein